MPGFSPHPDAVVSLDVLSLTHTQEMVNRSNYSVAQQLIVISGNTGMGENREEQTDRIGNAITIETLYIFTYMYNAFYRLK